MLLIVLAFLVLATSFNGEKVADWYWDNKYKTEQQAAISLVKQNLITNVAFIKTRGLYELGDLIDFEIQTQDGPYLVQRYQPSPLEQDYVRQAYPSGQLVVHYEVRFPNRCVLKPTMLAAQRIAHRPKPARMPDDKISRFISLWGKVMAGLLFAAGLYSFRRYP